MSMEDRGFGQSSPTLGCAMRSLIQLLCVAASVWALQEVAHSQSDTCRFTEWGYGYMNVVGPDGAWTYSLKASGPGWRTAPYGYHAPGVLSCESCSQFGARGFYYFLPQSDLDAAP